MFRMIRVRLALSYAGIALLVTLSLGAVLLALLRSYYAGIEQDYLISNAKAIGSLAAPMLMRQLPKEVQDAQVSNLSFLSQTRVRILDMQQHVLADSGPWMPRKIGFGVMKQDQRMLVNFNGEPGPETGSASVIIIQNDGGNLHSVPAPNQGGPEISAAVPDAPAAPGGKGDVQFFTAEVPVTNGVYGLYLSRASEISSARSNQRVQARIFDSYGNPIGVVDLSESPAYGREIVSSVAAGLAIAGGLAILLAIAVGWLTSKRFTAPLLRLTEATLQMSDGDLSVRVIEAERQDEFGTLGKSFNTMAERIEDTVHTLRRFLADAAHELHTPLTALRTNLELAKSEENSASTAESITHALEQIERLQRMMADLLSLSRLESGNGQEAYQAVDLRELVQQVSEPFAAQAEQAGQAFELDMGGDHAGGSAVVLGSPEKLRSAIGNLMDNACKFTPAGGTITVRLSEEEDNLRVAVCDTGIGIPPEEIEMLYNRFHRGRNASAYPGSGLGLAIVRAIAQAHGGSVSARNNEHGGACFTLSLPRVGSGNSGGT